MALLHFLQPRRNVCTAMDLIELVGHQKRGNAFTQQLQHLGVGLVEHAGLHHKQDQIDITHGAKHGFVE